ncbi:MAG TPA: alkaline phosphatase family protein [Chitinophagaceae bacterium]|nr:alkaline phosphatase family protein [Chitinophagaceae bacterium]
MNKILFTLCLTFGYFISISQPKNERVERPKLVVGIVVDQMRPDYLYRFANRFGKNGFLRMMQDGNVCENTFINYLPSFTAPGHACVYTGSVPSLHGIASNDWTERASNTHNYCVADKMANNVGGTTKAGKMSPKNLWANTITDELRLATNFRAKVIAVSVKDRGAILPGGHSSNGSYWMDDSNGVFMTSDFYMKKLPNWVSQFNQQNKADFYMKKDWNTLYPIETYIESTKDDNSYESKLRNESNTAFPHKTSTWPLNDIKKVPYGNDMVCDFAKEALINEHLGQDDETDFLAVSFSSTDYVGHYYGPNSIELEDTYLRLDKNIASLFELLDREVGQGNYTIFLTADHAAAHNPQFLIDQKIPAGFLFASTIKTVLDAKLENQFGEKNILSSVYDNYLWLNDSIIKAHNLDKSEIKKVIIDELKFRDEIQYVVDLQYAQLAPIPEKIKQKIINGFVEKRSGDLILILKPGWIDAYSKTGTTHGAWNPYDTHIPLVWYGWGIKPGATIKEVYMTDIAATLATLLHIQMPNACIGTTIQEVLK